MDIYRPILTCLAFQIVTSLFWGLLSAAEPMVFNDNAGWCWYQDERVIVHDNKLIMGSVADASGPDGSSRDGNIEVTTYDLNNGGMPITFVLHANLQGDDHDLPAFLALPDDRILAMYSKHSSDRYIRRRITSNPNDTSQWQPELIEERNASVCYSNLFRLSAENGRIYDFYRGENYNPNYIVSDDDGQSWYYGGHLIRKDGHRPYVKYASNNIDTIHFITTEGHPRNYDNSIYHGYIFDGGIYRSDGTKIQNLTDGPVAPEQLTRVFPGDADNVAWTTDIHLDINGNPYIAFSVQKDGAGLPSGQGGFDIRYYYSRWDGSGWHVSEMAYAGTKLYAGEDDYSGLVALDPQNPDIVYISTDANPYSGEPLVSSADSQRHYEIFRGTTTDMGENWTWAPITRNSIQDNIRPIVPIWDGPYTILLWTRGKLTTFTNFNLAIVGLFDPQPIDPDAPFITNSPDDILANEGDTVTFAVDAISPLSMHYYWYKQSESGPDALIAIDIKNLILTAITSADQGIYYCEVVNSAGTARSASARLTIGGLIGHWPLDGNYQDTSGNHRNASPGGAPSFTQDRSVGTDATYFDGSSWLDCGSDSSFDLSTGGTVCAWIKTPYLDNAWASIAGKGRWTWRLCRNNNTSAAAYHIDTSAGAMQANGATAIIDNQWHHVAGTYDGNTLTLYVDGHVDVAVPASGTISPQPDPLWIGGRSDAGRYWNGIIDDVRIYSYALPAESIEALYLKKECMSFSPYDLNRDCIVNILDLAIFTESWLECNLMPRENCQ